jgi:hypothetical protein
MTHFITHGRACGWADGNDDRDTNEYPQPLSTGRRTGKSLRPIGQTPSRSISEPSLITINPRPAFFGDEGRSRAISSLEITYSANSLFSSVTWTWDLSDEICHSLPVSRCSNNTGASDSHVRTCNLRPESSPTLRRGKEFRPGRVMALTSISRFGFKEKNYYTCAAVGDCTCEPPGRLQYHEAHRQYHITLTHPIRQRRRRLHMA